MRSEGAGQPISKTASQRQAQLEQLTRLPTDPVIGFVELFGARMTPGVEM